MLWLVCTFELAELLVGEEVDPKLGCSNPDLITRLGSIINILLRERLVSIEDLKLCLELDKLNLFRLTQQDDFTKRIKRINTQRYYTQHKFNLIREENEGYSKLLTFLHQSKLTESTLLSVISSTIGLFSLDPNRVFDMLLDACEFEPSKYVLIRNLFSEFKTEEISRILRFKFVFYQTHNVIEKRWNEA